MICLPPETHEKFKQALISGKINPDKLESMSSDERHSVFKDIVGDAHAGFANKEFEGKLLLKNKQQGYLTWAKGLTGVKEPVKRDLISRISRMDSRILDPATEKSFLADLAEAKLGVGVSVDEAKTISSMSQGIQNSTAVAEDAVKTHGYTDASKAARVEAGANKVALQNYVDSLKAGSTKKTVGQLLNPVSYGSNLKAILGATKGLVASFTSHAPLKHGFFALFEDPAHWAKNYVTQFSDAAKQIAGKDVMSAIKAEGYSRENAMNGIYDKWIPGELNKSNEEFHSGLVEKIPILGSRFYKGSKTMFDGFNLKMRMDLVDHYVNIVKKMGLDPQDPETAKAWGKLAIDQTGGKTTNPDNIAGNFLFSQRLLKSEANNLTLHLFDKSATKAVKVQSAKTLAKVVAGVAAVIYTANKIKPGSAEIDPRSANFGKIKVGDTRFDISGGYSSILTLASRIAERSTKSSATGIVTPIGSGFGQTSYQTLLGDFLSGRAAPAGQIVADYANGKTFSGKKPTLKTEGETAVTPIPVQTYGQLKDDPNSADHLAVMIAQQLGLMSNTYGSSKSQPSITQSTSKSMQALEKKVGSQKFNQLGQKYDSAYQSWFAKAQNNPTFQKMSATQQQDQIKGEKSHLDKTILKPAGYEVIKGKKTSLINQSAQPAPATVTLKKSLPQPNLKFLPHLAQIPQGKPTATQANFKFTTNPNPASGKATFTPVGGKTPIPNPKASIAVPVGTNIPVSKLQLYGDKSGNMWFEDDQGKRYTAKFGTPLLQVQRNFNNQKLSPQTV